MVILSKLLPQAISNQVNTTLVDIPGLRVDIYSNTDVVEACEQFLWTIDYYNDAGGDNDTTKMYFTLPNNVTFNGVSVLHKWNSQAISSGATPA